MVLCSKTQVPLPKQGIITRKTGKHQYVYKVTKTYRNQNKQPTNTRTAIGKLDPKTGNLIPNNNYYQHYNNYTTTNPTEKQTTTPNTTLTYQSIHSIGATYLIKKLYDNLNITQILTTIFGQKRTHDILTTATYMTTQNNILEHIQDWSQTHLINTPPLTSPAASHLFNSITKQEQIAFFQTWIKQQPKPPKYLAYDVTSFSSYAKNIAETEWGYNRDKEKLPQINIGCYLDQQTRLPLFYVSYPGSIVDKSHLPYMMAYNKTLNVGADTCHVMDRGFCSEANIVYMHNSKLQYIVGVEMDHKKIHAALKEVQAANDIVSMRNRVKDGGVYARLVSSCCFYGEAVSDLHVYFDAGLAARQRSVLYRRVEVLEERLCQLEQLTRREAKGFRRYFKVDLGVDGSFVFERDYVKIDGFDRCCGFFGLLTNVSLSSGEVLDVYRRRDVLEKGFLDLKNYLDMRRLRVHSLGVLDGKLFVAFVSLIVVCELSRLLSDFLRVRSLSKVGLFLELEKIRVVVLSDGSYLVNPLSKTQRDILEACGLTETDPMSTG